MKTLEEIKSEVINEIENEKKKIELEYSSHIETVKTIDNVPELIKKLTYIHGNSLILRDEMTKVLQSYLTADFFKDAFIGRESFDIVKGANNIFFKNEKYYVGFSTSKIAIITIGRNEELIEPKEPFVIIDDQQKEFLKKFIHYKETGENYDELANKFSLITRKKSSNFIYKLNKANRIEEYAKHIIMENGKFEKRKELYKESLIKYEKEKMECQEFLNSIDVDLDEFENNGWKLKYENIK